MSSYENSSIYARFMNVSIQNSLMILNMGVSLAAIDPSEGLMAGMRLEDGFASLHMNLGRRAHFDFAVEMADAAQALCRLEGEGPIPIGGRLETDFPRVHYLTSFFEAWNGCPGLGERIRYFTTREERELTHGEFIYHGDRFTLICVQDGCDPVSLWVGKESRGFQNRVAQFRRVSVAEPLRPDDESSEMMVGGTAAYWRDFLTLDARAGLDALMGGRRQLWTAALWIAAALYLEDIDRYGEGFVLRTKDGRNYDVRLDDRGRPYLLDGPPGDLKGLKPDSIRSAGRVSIHGEAKRALKIQVSGNSVLVRERRAGHEAGFSHVWLAAAAVFGKRSIDAEMLEFHEADAEHKRAYLELARFIEGNSRSRLL